jgi:hypothetical protein
MLHMLQWLHTYVASVRSKCFIYFSRCILQVCLFRCCICVIHMLQEYIQNVSAVLVLCCNKCFNVASCKRFIWMLHMFYTHVASVCVSNVSSASDVCCIQVFHVASVSCFREVCLESHGAQTRRWRRGAASQGPTCGWGARRAWGPMDGACSSSFRLSGPTRTERGGIRGKERRAQGRPRRMGAGYACVADEADKEGLQ